MAEQTFSLANDEIRRNSGWTVILKVWSPGPTLSIVLYHLQKNCIQESTKAFPFPRQEFSIHLQVSTSFT